jgi:hypothetical protein
MTTLDSALGELATQLEHRPLLWTDSGPSEEAKSLLAGDAEASVIVHRFVAFGETFARAREIDIEELDSLVQNLELADADFGRDARAMVHRNLKTLEAHALKNRRECQAAFRARC